ncbi:tetratricopeptide repeat protein [Rhodospirillales bacterium]|nr:tetratricopeptide repeat protein [Rhodospirillales bacterium]
MANSDTKTMVKKAHGMFRDGNLLLAADLCRDTLKIDANNLEALNLLAAVLTEGGLYEQALKIFQKSLLVGGPNSTVLYDYGVALRVTGRLIEAIRAFKTAVQTSPERADCWFILGETQRRLGNHSEAIKALERATLIDTDNSSYLFTLGNAFLDTERPNDAVAKYQAALRLAPENIEYKNNLGVALRKVDKLDDAVQIFKEILTLNSKNTAVQNNLGLAFTQLGQYSEAETAYLSALNTNPDYSNASLNLADLYTQLADFKKAEHCLNRAILRDIDNSNLLIKLGIMVQKQGRLKEAREILTGASDKKDSESNSSTALANVLRDLGEFESAVAILENLPTQPSEYPGKLANLALIYQHQGELNRAEDLLHQAINKEPNNINLHINLAHTLLSGGKFKDGWKEFRWRHKQPETQRLLNALPGKLWNGEKLSGKSILVMCEQGVGDSFQFARFLPSLSKKCRDFILSVPPKLFRFFDEGFKGCPVISMDDLQPDRDFHVLLMDLPLLLGITNASAIIPYFQVGKKNVERWAKRLPTKKLKVGLSWQGNPGYETDYLRSIPFSVLTPLIENSDAEFVSIQKENTAEVISTMSKFLNLGPELDKVDSFIDTAAVMMDLDLIITSDTAAAHLAGALGRPVWLLLNSAPDWRWQLNRQDSPWYPTMRLFRQRSPGDWTTVVKEVLMALKNFQLK